MSENYDVSQSVVDVTVEDITDKVNEEQQQEETEEQQVQEFSLTPQQIKEAIANYEKQKKKAKLEKKKKQSFAYEVGRLDGIKSARKKQVALNRLINKVQRENDIRKQSEETANEPG
jgi:trehalose-6-phosphate synthase